MFSSDDSGLPDNAGGTGDASIGSDIGSVAAPVPVVDLLGEDVDITPARHLPSDSVARVSLDLLTRHRSSLQTLLAELPHLLPDLPPDRPPAGAAPRGSSLEELAQSGMLYIRRTAPRAVIEESSLPKVRRTIITGRDLVRAVPPTEEDDVPDDEVLRPRVREGDVLVPHVARQLIARVAQGQDVGAVLSSSVVLIRPDSAVLDPWYLAGLLSSSDSGRQATRMASTLGDTVRFDPRRVRIPVLPIEDQRTHGAAFRRLADLARTLRAAHDEGQRPHPRPNRRHGLRHRTRRPAVPRSPRRPAQRIGLRPRLALRPHPRPRTRASRQRPRPAPLRPAPCRPIVGLNAGGDPAQIAARAGHSVTVLFTVYSHCIHGQDHLLNQQIDHVLEPSA